MIKLQNSLKEDLVVLRVVTVPLQLEETVIVPVVHVKVWPAGATIPVGSTVNTDVPSVHIITHSLGITDEFDNMIVHHCWLLISGR